MRKLEFHVSTDELMAVFKQKYSREPVQGWGPPLRLKHNYFTPDDHYEALVGKLLPEGADWCDVGCGRDIFPQHPELAKQYASRCKFVFGIDPDRNVRDNAFVHAFYQGLVDDCTTEYRFDLVTMRMVAEHIEDPVAALSSVARMLKPKGRVVVYTPHKWAPMSVVASVVPDRLHNPLKHLLWKTEERDTFPTRYNMNTFADLDRSARQAGLQLVYYALLDDCRTTTEYRLLNTLELGARSLFRAAGFAYPEKCILAVLQLSTDER